MAKPHSIAGKPTLDEAPTAMPFATRLGSRAELVADAKPPHPRSLPRLNAAMRCDTAFRALARCCLQDLAANHDATCRNDHDALHEMRVALTRLRTTASFFAPMVQDANSDALKRELKWLNGHLGATRDVDVAIDRLKAASSAQPTPSADNPNWEQKSTASHRELTRRLRSVRYRRLIRDLSDWIENGVWSTATTATAERRRARPIGRYSRKKLTRWHEKLLGKASRLEDMGAKERHRLRLANKRVRYAIEFFEALFAGEPCSMRATLKHLRKAQQYLGELNDTVNGQALLAVLQRDPPTGGVRSPFSDREREKKLLRRARRTYRKMAALSPLCA